MSTVLSGIVEDGTAIVTTGSCCLVVPAVLVTAVVGGTDCATRNPSKIERRAGQVLAAYLICISRNQAV